MDGGAWWAAVHGVAKSRTQLSDFAFTFHFHALEKEMATHSSILSLENPWGHTESLKRLSSSSRFFSSCGGILELLREFRMPLVLAQGSPVFHSSCEGKLGIALE